MKKFIAFLIITALMFSISIHVSADNDVFMMYDAEDLVGNGQQNGWGEAGGLDYSIFTEGSSSATMISFNDRLAFFHNCENDPNVGLVDTTNYTYVECDIYSYYELICNFQLSLVGNGRAQNGDDWTAFEVYFPEQEWVHIRMPLDEFVTHTAENPDPWGEESAKTPDSEHYDSNLSAVYRLTFEFTHCFDAYGEAPLEVNISFDNVVLTRNGAGAQTQLRTWEDVQNESTQPSSSAVVSSQPSISYGDVDSNGEIDAQDALLALQFSVDKISLSEAQRTAANVDGIGSVASGDALLILQYSVNKISKFPVEG